MPGIPEADEAEDKRASINCPSWAGQQNDVSGLELFSLLCLSHTSEADEAKDMRARLPRLPAPRTILYKYRHHYSMQMVTVPRVQLKLWSSLPGC